MKTKTETCIPNNGFKREIMVILLFSVVSGCVGDVDYGSLTVCIHWMRKKEILMMFFLL